MMSLIVLKHTVTMTPHETQRKYLCTQLQLLRSPWNYRSFSSKSIKNSGRWQHCEKKKNDENQRKKKLISLFVPYHKKPLPHLSSPSPLPNPQLGFRGKRLIDKLTLYTLTPVYISPHCSLHIPSDTDKDNFFDNRELLESMIVSWPFALDSRVKLKGEIRSWSLLRIKGLISCVIYAVC